MENRITDLEIKLTHAESTIEILNSAAFEQQKQINNLTKRLDIMQDYMQSIGKQMNQVSEQVDEAPPPHY